MASPGFGGFTPAEKIALLAAVKAELLRRAGVGSIQTGAQTGSSFSMMKIPTQDLYDMMDELATQLGYSETGGPNQAIPNFSCPTR